MRRRPFIVILILFVLVLMSAFALAQPERTQATLVVLKGQATVVQGGRLLAAAEKIVTPSQAVLVWAGDEIRVGRDAAAQLRLFDGSTIDLDQNTVVQMTELQTNPESYRVQLDLLAGKLLSRVKRVLGSGDTFDITTPSSTASVRGTVFTVAVVAPDVTYIACSEGTVAVQMGAATTLVPAGTELTATVGQPLQVLPHSEIDAAAAPGSLPTTTALPQVTPTAMMALPSVAASSEEPTNSVVDLPGTTPASGLSNTPWPPNAAPTAHSSILLTHTRTNGTVNLPTSTATAVPFNNTPTALPPTPAPFGSITPVPTASRTPVPNHTATTVPTVAATSTQVPTAAPAPTATPVPTQPPIVTPLPTSTAAPTQAPTATPVTPPPPTATPLPSHTPEPSPTSGASQITICHKPNGPNPQTMTIPESDLPGHLGHGDTIGPCP